MITWKVYNYLGGFIQGKFLFHVSIQCIHVQFLYYNTIYIYYPYILIYIIIHIYIYIYIFCIIFLLLNHMFTVYKCFWTNLSFYNTYLLFSYAYAYVSVSYLPLSCVVFTATRRGRQIPWSCSHRQCELLRVAVEDGI